MSTDPIDPGLLRKNAHSPSFFALQRASSGRQDLVDFCIPCNPYFPTPGMFSQLSGSLEHILKYYPSDADTITAELCATLGHNPQTVVMGNGSTELITWIDHLLVRESLATPIPTFGRWTDQPMETGKRVDMFQLHELRGFEFDVDAFVQFVRARGRGSRSSATRTTPTAGTSRGARSSGCWTASSTWTWSWWTSRSWTSWTPRRTPASRTRPASGPT